jgi:hypothetical protein
MREVAKPGKGHAEIEIDRLIRNRLPDEKVFDQSRAFVFRMFEDQDVHGDNMSNPRARPQKEWVNNVLPRLLKGFEKMDIDILFLGHHA